MRPSDSAALVLILEESLATLQVAVGRPVPFERLGPGLLAVDLPEAPNLQATSLEARRYLDRFILVSPPGQAAHSQLVDAFFELIAQQYGTLIDVRRNTENISALLNVVLDQGPGDPEMPIVDFGCGIGLSTGVAKKAGVVLEGIDNSPTMRMLARERGLKILEPHRFAERLESCRGAIASYVFHYRPSEQDLARMWSLLTPGAVVAGNFHKNSGIDWVAGILEGLGAVVQAHPPHGRLARHGTYLTAWKSL